MISGFFLRITVAVLLATPLCPATDAHSVGCPTRRAPGAVIPFELIGDHIYVSAKVNGSGPYRFIVDTGGVNLVDSSLVKPLSLQITGQETGHGVGAETVESGKTTIDRLDLGNHTFTSEKFYTFDLDQLYPGGGVKMMGMVGAPLFARYATCIDFSRHEIELINPADLDRQPAGTVLPMSTKESVITIHASFDGVPGVFQVDTGSPTTLTLNTPFVTKHDLLSRFPRHVESSSGGVGGSVREYTVRGKNLVLGSLSIVNPITALAVASKGNFARADLAGNIGNGALKRYVVTFDLPGHRLYLQPYEPAPPNLDTYNRSGLRIDVEPTGFRVVSVAKGTPAAEAGIRVGDLIVTVNGKPSTSISLPEIRDELRERPAGSVFTMGVRTDDKTREVQLTLRELL
jgi:hypothetical protein